MRTLLAGLATLALGLATCLDASAQAENQNQNRDRDRNQNNTTNNQRDQGEAKVIRGVIAGVTVEGETAIDFRTNRAVIVESTYLTIVGSERSQGRSRDADDAAGKRDRDDQNDRNARDRRASSDGQRDNIYVVWLTPRTEIRKASDRRNDRDRGEQNANKNDPNRNESNNQRNQNDNANANRGGRGDALAVDALEVGDLVEVRFIQRSAASDNPNAMNRKHGRARTYFGEATAVTILSEPGQNDRDRDRDGDRDRDSDRQQNRDQNKRGNTRDHDRDN